jgi:hypothetical protein
VSKDRCKRRCFLAILGFAFLGLLCSLSFSVSLPGVKMGQTLLEGGLSSIVAVSTSDERKERAPTLTFRELSEVGLRQISNSTSSSVSSKDENTELLAPPRNISVLNAGARRRTEEVNAYESSKLRARLKGRLRHYCARRNRLTDPTRFPRDTKGIAFPRFPVSQHAAAAAERRSNNSSKRITVFGIGTGRSGTASLARLLQRQNRSLVSHENGPKMLQQAGSGCSSSRIVWAGDFRMAVKQKNIICYYPCSFPSLFFPSTKMIFHAGL